MFLGGALKVLNYMWCTPTENFESPCGLYDIFLENKKQPKIKTLPTGLQCTLPVPCFIQTL
jgi:hypothetical protein